MVSQSEFQYNVLWAIGRNDHSALVTQRMGESNSYWDTGKDWQRRKHFVNRDLPEERR